MARITVETIHCEDCGRMIPPPLSPFLRGDRTVCKICYDRFNRDLEQAMAEAATAVAAPPETRMRPAAAVCPRYRGLVIAAWCCEVMAAVSLGEWILSLVLLSMILMGWAPLSSDPGNGERIIINVVIGLPAAVLMLAVGSACRAICDIAKNSFFK